MAGTAPGAVGNYVFIPLAQYQQQYRRSAGFDARAGSMLAMAATLVLGGHGDPPPPPTAC